MRTSIRRERRNGSLRRGIRHCLKKREKTAETRGDKDEMGVFVESVKRNGCAASSAGRRDIRASMAVAFRASTVLEYSIFVVKLSQQGSNVKVNY